MASFRILVLAGNTLISIAIPLIYEFVGRVVYRNSNISGFFWGDNPHCLINIDHNCCLTSPMFHLQNNCFG
jgi:hypothetical protein